MTKLLKVICVRRVRRVCQCPLRSAPDTPPARSAVGTGPVWGSSQRRTTVRVTFGQPAASRVSAAFSVLSTVRPHRFFTATHSPT